MALTCLLPLWGHGFITCITYFISPLDSSFLPKDIYRPAFSYKLLPEPWLRLQISSTLFSIASSWEESTHTASPPCLVSAWLPSLWKWSPLLHSPGHTPGSSLQETFRTKKAALHFHFTLSYFCDLAHTLPSTRIAFSSPDLLLLKSCSLSKSRSKHSSWKHSLLLSFMNFMIPQESWGQDSYLIHLCVSYRVLYKEEAQSVVVKCSFTDLRLDSQLQISLHKLNPEVTKLMDHLLPYWQEMNPPKPMLENYLSSRRTTSDPLEAGRSKWFLGSQGVLTAERGNTRNVAQCKSLVKKKHSLRW